MKKKTAGDGVQVPNIITHKNMQPLLEQLTKEAEFQLGPTTYKPTGQEWYRQPVRLEMPMGELAKDGLQTIALVGRRRTCPGHLQFQPHMADAFFQIGSLTGKEGFNAQGLEGKVIIHKDLFTALLNLRDLIPVHRGRIVVKG